MSHWLCTAWFVLLLTAVAWPAGAQQPAKPLVEQLRLEEAHRQAAALQWAQHRRLPVRHTHPDGRTFALVALEDDRPIYLTTLNRQAADATRTSYLYPGARLGLGLTGRGLRLGIWDSGLVLKQHEEFADRVVTMDQTRTDNHATHVAGTLIAAGVRLKARGMAYEADLHSYDWNGDAAEIAQEAERGLLISNHSYGTVSGWYYGNIEGAGAQWYWFGDPDVSTVEDYFFGRYSTAAVQFDEVTYAHPHFLPVVAAGNERDDLGPASGTYRMFDRHGQWVTASVADHYIPRDGGTDGFDSVAGAAVAKNALTVGAVGFDPNEVVRISSFSSFGPADDGRIKPDLVGYGEDVFSTLANPDIRYTTFSGTSMATPNVAGTLLLLQQHAHNLRHTYLQAATLKALALHTARDLGRPGPDYQYGWGLLDAAAAAEHVSYAQTDLLALFEGSLQDGDTFDARAVVDEAGPLRVTLAWTDPPSTRRPVNGPEALNERAPHLLHDLDLRVTHEVTGTIHAPHVLDPARPALPATTGDNRVDPVEQVYVAEVPPGPYRIEVTHKGRLQDPAQPFSLVVTGARDAIRTVAVDFFTADASVDAVVLHWQTLFEQTQGTFYLQRAPLSFSGKTNGPFGVLDSLATQGRADAGTHPAYTFTDAPLLSGRYLYQLIYQGPRFRYVAAEATVNVVPPETYGLVSNYPNPAHDHTTLVLDLRAEQHVRADIYDALGRRVTTLYDERLDAGRHRLLVDTSSWPSGLYVVRVQAYEGTITHRLIVAH